MSPLRRWAQWVVVGTAVLLLFWVAATAGSWSPALRRLTTSVHGPLVADYRGDSLLTLAPLSPDITRDASQDQADSSRSTSPSPGTSPSGGPSPTGSGGGSPSPSATGSGSPLPTLPVPTPTLPVPTPSLPVPTPTLPVPTPTLPVPTPSVPVVTPTLPPLR